PDIEQVFGIIWQNPDDPEIAAAAESMFNGADSLWRDLSILRGPGIGIIESPLMGMPAFRKNVLANLANRRKIGVVSVRNGQMQTDLDSGMHMGGGVANRSDPLLPKPDE